MMRASLPYARAGQVVGLLGGSFDPAHSGHVDLTRAALRRFGLDRVWWLVSPGNPLKVDGPAPLATRMERACAIMQHPRVEITDMEARIGTRYTARTLARLQALYPGVRFVWLMGADNLAQFHRGGDWEDIMQRVPVGVIARPGDRISARMSRTARIYRAQQLPGRDSALLGRADPPAWCFINMPMNDVSSTQMRADGAWQR
jgi:nicotinate-nucleotide adenylyltransferase